MRCFFLGFVFLVFSEMLFAQQSTEVQPGVISSYQKGLQGIGPDFGNNPASENLYNQMRDKFANLGIEQKLELEDIEGSIYLNDDFKLGTILFKRREERKMYLRYNAFNDEFEIKNANLAEDKTLALHKNEDISCVLENDTYYYKVFLNKKSERTPGYLKIAYSSGHYALFEQNRKWFKEGKQAETSFAVSFPHRFVRETNFYISIDGGVPDYVPSKKKELVELFRLEHQMEVKKFIKEKRVNFKTKKGLVNLLAFCGNL